MDAEQVKAIIAEYLKEHLTIEVTNETVYATSGDGQWETITVSVYLDSELITRAQS